MNPENKVEEENKKWSPQIIILDPHGEYKEAFKDAVVLSTDDGSLSLPYWVMGGLEFLTLVFGKTLGTATNQVPKVRDAVTKLKQQAFQDETEVTIDNINIDSPIVFSFDALIKKIRK